MAANLAISGEKPSSSVPLIVPNPKNEVVLTGLDSLNAQTEKKEAACKVTFPLNTKLASQKTEYKILPRIPPEILETKESTLEEKKCLLLQQSKIRRQEKLLKLKPIDPEFCKNYEDFEASLGKVQELLEKKILFEDFKREVNNKSLLFKEYNIDFSFDEFEILNGGINFLFIEKMLNVLINKKMLIHKTDEFIQVNLGRILKAFEYGIDQSKKGEIKSIEYVLGGNETHNGGNSIVKVFFASEKGVFLKVVCKFRRATTDSAFLGLLSQLNMLPENKDKQFRIYNIVNPPRPSEEWYYPQEIAEVSIWEFIEGSIATSLDAKLKEIWQRAKQTDGHLANFIKDKTGNIVPIDMEARELHDKNPITELTSSKEKGFISTYVQECNEPFRLVPVWTQGFGELAFELIYRSSELLKNAEILMGHISKCNYNLTVSKEKLGMLLFWDAINNDVPYLTDFKGTLYFGLVSDNIPIGTRKNP